MACYLMDIMVMAFVLSWDFCCLESSRLYTVEIKAIDWKLNVNPEEKEQSFFRRTQKGGVRRSIDLFFELNRTLDALVEQKDIIEYGETNHFIVKDETGNEA